ncbi:MAG TPA: RDD family protein [Myxococcales bacterium]|jgi:uncharacterized RDD family membrane protein YckC
MEIREYSESGELSSRLDRLYAASIDWLLAAIFPVIALFGGFSWISGVFVQSMLAGKPPGPELRPSGPLAALLLGCMVAGLLLWFVQCWGLAVRGQTIGKRLLGIQIVDQFDRPGGFVRALLVRSWVFGFLVALVQGWVGPAGALIPLIDVLLIFLADRRCLHDYLAGTRVRNTALAHGRVLPVLAVFGIAAIGMGVLLAKVGVNLHLAELRQVAARPGVLPDALREQFTAQGQSGNDDQSGLAPEAPKPGAKGDVHLSPKKNNRIYRYEDDDGATQFSDELDSIPRKYRARATLVE